MGGKNNIFDPKKLGPIYLESRRFAQKAETSMHVIQRELTKLNDASFQGGLFGKQGDAAKDAIYNVSEAVGVLKNTIETANQFTESRLAGAAQLTQENKARSNSSQKENNFLKNTNLKK
jgi:DNA-binding helix-hairpin-helix protein with protein kinase domain